MSQEEQGRQEASRVRAYRGGRPGKRPVMPSCPNVVEEGNVGSEVVLMSKYHLLDRNLLWKPVLVFIWR